MDTASKPLSTIIAKSTLLTAKFEVVVHKETQDGKPVLETSGKKVLKHSTMVEYDSATTRRRETSETLLEEILNNAIANLFGDNGAYYTVYDGTPSLNAETLELRIPRRVMLKYPACVNELGNQSHEIPGRFIFTIKPLFPVDWLGDGKPLIDKAWLQR